MSGESPTSDDGKSADDPSRRRRSWHWLAAIGIVGIALSAAGALWRHSHRPEVRYLRAREALNSGDTRTVVQEVKVLLETPGYEPHGRLLSGLLHARSERYTDALYQLQFAARSEPTDVEALTVASECYYRLGQPAEATKTARTALARDPRALDARRWLASACYDLGAMADAISHLEIISAEAPDDARPEYLLGLIAKDNERFGDAILNYRESLRRNPQSPYRETLLFELAESLIRLSRFDEALEVLHDCGRTARTLTLTAECQQNLGRTKEAETLLQSAGELDPSYVPAQVQLGALYMLLGRPADARPVLEEAVRLDPQNAQAHFHLSQAAARLGDDPQSAEHLGRMQQIRALEREFSELHDVASQNPADADVRFRIGDLARKLGKRELARTWFRAALSLQPSHAAAAAALAELQSAPTNH